MSKLDTRKTRLGAVVQFEDHKEYGYCRKVIPFTAGANRELVAGTVIGATGDIIAAGGTFAGIYVGSPEGADFQSVANGATVNIVVLYRGPAAVGLKNLVFGADVDTDVEKNAIVDQIAAAGIEVLTQV